MSRLAVLILFFLYGCASKESAVIDYLGQKPPGMTPELFAPGIISTDRYEHSAPAFSPDGSVVLWTVMDTVPPAFLLEMKWENGKWSTPSKPSFSDLTADDFYPAFSPDGKTLYFSSRRKVPSGHFGGGDIRIWQVKRNSDGWGEPELFDTTVANGNDYAHSISSSGTLYFSSSLGGGTGFTIRSSKKNEGKNLPAVLLPYNINSVGYEDGPCISPDESFLIFESQRPEGYLRLYIAFRDEDGSWRMPVDMGPEINSGKGERFARLSPDGKYLFFGSYRNASATNRGADIFWVDAKIIEDIKKQTEAKITINQPLGDELVQALLKSDNASAANLLKQWVTAYPNSLDALVIYTAVLRKQQRYAEAEQMLSVHASKWNDNPDIIVEKSLLKYAVEKDQEAAALLKPVLATEPLRERLLYLSGSLFDMKRFDASDDYFQQAMTIYQHGVFWYNRACGYTHVNESDRAFAALDRAVAVGYNERKQFENDPDLQPLKNDKRWLVLLEKLK